MTLITLRLPPELLEQIDRWCQEQTVPLRQAALRYAIEKAFGRPARRKGKS
jgi:metal-responsive CopG/Arc/MetJ family transcriptional regulator